MSLYILFRSYFTSSVSSRYSLSLLLSVLLKFVGARRRYIFANLHRLKMIIARERQIRFRVEFNNRFGNQIKNLHVNYQLSDQTYIIIYTRILYYYYIIYNTYTAVCSFRAALVTSNFTLYSVDWIHRRFKRVRGSRRSNYPLAYIAVLNFFFKYVKSTFI